MVAQAVSRQPAGEPFPISAYVGAELPSARYCESLDFQLQFKQATNRSQEPEIYRQARRNSCAQEH